MRLFRLKKNNENRIALKDYQDAIEFIDYMALCLESGHHIQQSFYMASLNVSRGSFKEQCFKVIKFYELGFSFGQALVAVMQQNSKNSYHLQNSHHSQNSCQIANEVFENLSISLKFGTKVSKTLTQLSTQLRLSMVAGLEELAHEVPIKMIFPLVMFIFPVIFILIGTKAFVNFIQSLGA